MRALPARRRSEPGRRRPVRLVGWLLLALTGLAIVWVVVTGLIARSQLGQVRGELTQLRAAAGHGDIQAADRIKSRIIDHAGSAHALTSGPAWWTLAHLPLIGAPAEVARTIAEQADALSRQALPDAIDALGALRSARTATGGRLNLGVIESTRPRLRAAMGAATRAVAAIRSTPSVSWLPGMDGSRFSAITKLSALHDELDRADRAVETILPMLGADQPRHYFVGFENEAESRGLGGLPGGFAIVTIDRGRIRFTHFGNDTELEKLSVDVRLGEDYDRRYGAAQPTSNYTNSDISPHFPDAARIWAAMWQKRSGQHIDAAVAVDPTALSYLLRAVGPTALPDGTPVTADDVVVLTQQRVYTISNKDPVRDRYLLQIAKAVATRLTRLDHVSATITAARRAVHERRIALWSEQPSQEAEIASAGLGAVLMPSASFTGFTVVNAAGSKLDYYLNRTQTYTRTSCAAGATAIATMRLTNNAPASGLPPYVVFRADKAPPGARPGDNRVLLTYYASTGATIRSITIDGRPVVLASVPERGLVTVTTSIELPRGTSRTMRVVITEPAAGRELTVLRQPLARPLTVLQRSPHCG